MWFYMKGGERIGPVELKALRELVEDGTLTPENMVWTSSMGEKWSKIADVEVLAGPSGVVDDPAVKEDFQRKLEERDRLVAEQKKATMRRSAIIGAVAAALLFGVVSYVKGKGKREFGVSSSHPIGTLEKMESRLINDYQMEKETLAGCEHFAKPADKIFRYANGKTDKGSHVSERGSVTVGVDGEGRVQSILAAFPSPGQHGPLLNDRSIGSIFMNDMWLAHGGAEERKYLRHQEVLPEMGDSCGFANVPADAVVDVLETDRMRCIWAVFNPNTRSSLVYFETK